MDNFHTKIEKWFTLWSMKKYILFYGETYYPNGGSMDAHIFCETKEECESLIRTFFLKSMKSVMRDDLWFCYLDIEKDVTFYYSKDDNNFQQHEEDGYLQQFII